jgi:hypothetical protein
MGKNIRIRIRDKQPGLYFRELIKQFFGQTYLTFFDTDSGSGMEKNSNLGWKKSDLGSGMNIPDP